MDLFTLMGVSQCYMDGVPSMAEQGSPISNIAQVYGTFVNPIHSRGILGRISCYAV